jgi:thiamine kinase-like enzyme
MSELEELVTRAFQNEMAINKKALTADDVPANYEAITPEWLTAVLCRNNPGAKVTGFTVSDRDDGSSNRGRITLTYNDIGGRSGLPYSVFCKSATTLRNRILLSGSGAALGEATFYSKIRHRIEMEAPHAWYSGYNPETYGYFVLLKDLADEAEFCNGKTAIDLEQAKSMVNTLARLHARFYESPELGTESIPFKTWPKWWEDNIKATPAYGAACDNGFAAARHLIPERLFKRAREVWPATLLSAEKHRKLPQTLIHDDVHLGNWYIAATGEMGLGDWHIPCIGHWSRDFIYAIGTALTVENRRQWEDELLQYYLDRMAEYGVPKISYDEAWLWIREQIPAALSFWTITLRPAEGMPDMQPEDTSYEFVKRLATALDDHESLDLYT